ncbi:hypothetical protein BD289DRAFT_111676 [Coniella lustricola]|uniref:Ent-kaurene synthase n=1 Tax=Coniella lustricola TaxID=2025994 RepID=A0A2T3AG95_9PEZI|nr:hypothetical protein BD289DRAFT_111676 [Coniella lustricola]
MDTLYDTSFRGIKEIIKDLGQKLDAGLPFGSFSTSIYDTAWLARVRSRNGERGWLFPECFQYLLQNQQPDGGWPVRASEFDSIINPMAALVAMREHQLAEQGKQDQSLSADLEERIHRAETHLRSNLQNWDISANVHVGFEVLVPAMLAELESKGLHFEFQARDALMEMNQRKLKKFQPELLYTRYKTTLVHSLEAFVGKIDFDRVSHHLDQHGSMMASPAATAAYLMHHSTWDGAAETYLRNAVSHSCGAGSGGVPGAYPSSNFEITWILSTILKARPSKDLLALPEIDKIRSYVLSQYESGGGVIGWDAGLLEDSDDTAKAVLSLNLLGVGASPARLIEGFGSPEHFRTYKTESNSSFSANCNILDALLHTSDPRLYTDEIVKIARFLCSEFNTGEVRDKWNLSESYSRMLVSQALVKLLQSWDSDQLGEVPTDLISEEIPKVLLQILAQTLQIQSSDGSWKFNKASKETTAYAILTLKALASLPWHATLAPQVQQAIQRGSAYLDLNHSSWGVEEHIWVAKATYALPPITRAYILAALSEGPVHSWQSKATSIGSIAEDKVTKTADFFSSLPLFSQDDLWVLKADVLLGYFFLSQLLRTSTTIFPPKKEADNKYIELIPFTWIATNRRNQYPLSNSALQEMMKLSLLIYQLDEFVETLFSRNSGSCSIEQVRQIVNALGETGHQKGQLPATNCVQHNGLDTSGDKISGQPNGIPELLGRDGTNLSLAEVKHILESLTSYVLQHAAVVQSPPYVRRQLQATLKTGLLAHLASEEDNVRYGAQRRADSKAKPPSSSLLSPAPPQVIPYTLSRQTYYAWVQNTSADNTQGPSALLFFTCLAAPPGEAFFRGARQHYISSALSKHLASLCRQYNDYGSIIRDVAEGNLNSLNFIEFHESEAKVPDEVGGQDLKQTNGSEDRMRSDLFFIAEYERECLNHALNKLDSELARERGGAGKIKALHVFIDTVDLYGQIYVAKDISRRLK